MVVTSGASTMLREGERKPVEMVVDEVEFAGALERVRDVQRLPDPAVHRRDPPRNPWRKRRRGSAVVTESSVANNVTSTPRATSPSASRLVTCSHGP